MHRGAAPTAGAAGDFTGRPAELRAAVAGGEAAVLDIRGQGGVGKSTLATVLERKPGTEREYRRLLWNVSPAGEALGKKEGTMTQAEAALRLCDSLGHENAAREALAEWQGGSPGSQG